MTTPPPGHPGLAAASRGRGPVGRQDSAGRPRGGGARPTAARPAAARPADGRPRAASAAGSRRHRGRALGRPGQRLRGALLVTLVALAVLAGRLVQLQGLSSTAYAASAERQRTRSTVLVAERGSITDRNGQTLAADTDGSAVYGEPHTIAKAVCPSTAVVPCRPDTIAAVLAPVLGRSVAEVTTQLSRDTAFVYLARDLDPAVGATVRSLDLVGIGTLSEPRRSHPGKDLAANVIGFTDRDRQGAAGAELGWNKVLIGQDGSARAEVDNAGHVIATADQHLVEPERGHDVRLTIDRDLQFYAQQVLQAKIAETSALNGSVVVMDVKTGQILAMASGPTFDADNPGAATPDQFRNTPVTDMYEPGSVTKVITAAAALEAGVVTPDTVLTVPGQLQVADRVFHDSHAHGTEHLTFTGVIAESSNIGTIEVAQQLGADRVHDAMVRFGFGQKTGLGLPGENRGSLPDTKDWSGTSIATIPIGQGVAANAVQVASVYATVANDGVRIAPSIINATVDHSGKLTPAPAPAQQRIINSQVAAQLRIILEGVVSAEGTAPLAAIPGYRIAGKTGTAARVVNGKYQAGNYTSSFAGFAPADAPRLVTAVVLQGTGAKDYYGGSVAGPVFKDVMGFALGSEQIPPTNTQPPVLRLTAD